jgi:hypothetical protein
MNDSQIVSYETNRRRLLLKSYKLGVVEVSICLPPEYRLGKQSFAPQSNQTTAVKILRMEAPKTHFRRVRLPMLESWPLHPVFFRLWACLLEIK